MDYNKEWWKSKTVISSAVALVLACVTAALGEGSAAIGIIIALASALGIYGRVTAKTKLTS